MPNLPSRVTKMLTGVIEELSDEIMQLEEAVVAYEDSLETCQEENQVLRRCLEDAKKPDEEFKELKRLCGRQKHVLDFITKTCESNGRATEPLRCLNDIYREIGSLD